jgi:hypothetical protein
MTAHHAPLVFDDRALASFRHGGTDISMLRRNDESALAGSAILA